jgi:hypothetical protein
MRLKIILVIWLLIFENLYAKCSESNKYWQNKIRKYKTIEEFFIDNYNCKDSFYKKLSTPQKIYFDTVLYPNKLSKKQYINRWKTMLFQNDKEFFKNFSFFNNYFNTHRDSITQRQLQCFQKQKGFKTSISKSQFFCDIEKKEMDNDVNYLYPLIRWAYQNRGVDMNLSKKRIEKAKDIFGIKVGKIGDREQFARYLAIFDKEYDYVAKYLGKSINISKIKAYKLLVTLTFLESRGNIFALSSTGAFGPLQLTMHYYMMYGQPNNPFNPKSSLIKLANKFIYYNKIGKSLDTSVVAYKSGSLQKCIDTIDNSDVDCRYYYDYKKYMYKMRKMVKKDDISKYLTGKSYRDLTINKLNRSINIYSIKQYEPYQYAIVKGDILSKRVKNGLFIDGRYFKSLGKMKRSDIYKLQKKYGDKLIGVISDKRVCY